MSVIHVCALEYVPEVVAGCGAQDLVTILREDYPFQRPAGIAPERHLHLAFNDIVAPREGLTLARDEHLGALLAFLRRWPREAPLLIHCFAGVSRSTAAAFIAACALMPEREETFWAGRLRALSPTATPNAHLVALADARLGREGRMTSAIAAIGRGAECHSGLPFALDLRVS